MRFLTSIKFLSLFTACLLTVSSLQARQWIMFCADDANIITQPNNFSLTGHTFVMFIQEDFVLKQTKWEKCVGFYPLDQTVNIDRNKWKLIPVAGTIKEDWNRNIDSYFTLEVEDINTYEKCKDIATEWLHANYQLNANDCRNFVREILLVIGAKAPPYNQYFEFPIDYINRLKELNKDFNVQSDGTLLNSTFAPLLWSSDTLNYTPIQPVHPVPSNLLGGATPDELGKILLKAIKINDDTTWVRCLDPNGDFDRNTKCLSRIRECLRSEGLTDWSKVEFNRVTYGNKYGPDDKRTFYNNIVLEFYYRNRDFIGVIYFDYWSVLDNKILLHTISTIPKDFCRMHDNTLKK